MFRKILAATAALTLGLGGVLALAAPASAAEDCTTETTGWVTESPGPNWVQTDERTVIDQEGTDGSYSEWVNEGKEVTTEENVAPGDDTDTVRWIFVKEIEGEGTVTAYQHYSLKGNSGLGKDDVPVFPADYWQANAKQEPHTKGNGDPATWVAPGTPKTGGLHYTSKDNKGHQGEGKRDWFYLEVTQVPNVDYVWQQQVRTFTPGEDSVTHQEFVFEKTTCTDVPVDEPNNPQNQPPTELPGTGAGDVLPWAGLGIVLLLSGLLAYMVTSRRRSSSI